MTMTNTKQNHFPVDLATKRGILKMCDQSGRLMTPEEEEHMLSGFLDGFQGKPYCDPLFLFKPHRMPVCIPLESSLYRLAFLAGQILRRNNNN
jgi:hypothetical protein